MVVMMNKYKTYYMTTETISVHEIDIRIVPEINDSIVEFGERYDVTYFENRYKDRSKLIVAGYVGQSQAGYMVAYDKFQDGSFYCWMTGVNPLFRRRGVLRAMMKYLVAWMRERGYHTLRIKTRNNRREMLSFLVREDFMFTEVESEPHIEDYRVSAEKRI
jgi:ribosomal protein S18 acetylase RimI-like enzyme